MSDQQQALLAALLKRLSDHPAASDPWRRKMMQERDNRWPQ